MDNCTRMEYEKIKNLSQNEFEQLKTKWLTRLYENKYEADKLYIDFGSYELRALVIILFKELKR